MSAVREALAGQHRRGRSLPTTMAKHDRDEDLALFHDMRRRERVNYLHPSSDTEDLIEASLSTKYGVLSGFRASALAHHRHSNDLLVSDPDKNDYDWLLTPPGTPLFPSLDHDSSLGGMVQGGLYPRYVPPAKPASRLSSGKMEPPKVEPVLKVGTRGNLSPRRPSTPTNGASAARGRSTVPASTPLPSSRPSSRPSSPSGRPSIRAAEGPGRPATPNSRTPASSDGAPASHARPASPADSLNRSSSYNGRPSTPTDARGRLTSSNGRLSSASDGNVRPSTPGTRPSTAGARPASPGPRVLDSSARAAGPARPSTPNARSSVGEGNGGASVPNVIVMPVGPVEESAVSEAGIGTQMADVMQQEWSSAGIGTPGTPGDATTPTPPAALDGGLATPVPVIDALPSPQAEGKGTSVIYGSSPSTPDDGFLKLPRIAVRALATGEGSGKSSAQPGKPSSPGDGFGRFSPSEWQSPTSVEGAASSGKPSPSADGPERTISRPSTPRSRIPTFSSSKPSSPVMRSTANGARPSTPTRSLSTHSSASTRSSTPTSTSARSSTPTLRRTSSGPTTTRSTSSTRGGPSPTRGSVAPGSSASPKSKMVYPAMPDFPSEPPPNLRTCLAEGQSASTRGPSASRRSSSPALRAAHTPETNDASSRPRGRAASPSLSRNYSDRSSSQTSRGSVLPFHDDGVEVTRPNLLSSRADSRADTRRSLLELEGRMASKLNLNSKRVGKPSGARDTSIFGGSFPRKSTDWQHVELRSSANAFRPLQQSSACGSSFFSGGSSNLLHRTGPNVDSSIATSSNASSERAVSIAADTEGSEQDVDELIPDWNKRVSPSRSVQILVLDKDDEKSSGWGGSQDDRDEKREGINFDRYEVESNAGSEATTTYGSIDAVSVDICDPDSRSGEASSYNRRSLRLGSQEDHFGSRDEKPEMIYAFPSDTRFDGSCTRKENAITGGENKEVRKTDAVVAVEQDFVDIQEDQSTAFRGVQKGEQDFVAIDTSTWTDMTATEGKAVSTESEYNREGSHPQQSQYLSSNCGSNSTSDRNLSAVGDTDLSSELQSQASSLSLDHRYSHDWTDIRECNEHVVTPAAGLGSAKCKPTGRVERESMVNDKAKSTRFPQYSHYSPSSFYGKDDFSRSTDTGVSTSTSSWDDHHYGLDLKYWDSKGALESPAFSEEEKVQQNVEGFPGDVASVPAITKQLVSDSVCPKSASPIKTCPATVTADKRVSSGDGCFDMFLGLIESKQDAAYAHTTNAGKAEDESGNDLLLPETNIHPKVASTPSRLVPVGSRGPGHHETAHRGTKEADVVANKVHADVNVEAVEGKDEGSGLSAVIQKLEQLKKAQAAKEEAVGEGEPLVRDPVEDVPPPALASVEKSEKVNVNPPDALSLFIDGFEEQFHSETADKRTGGEVAVNRARSPLRAFQQSGITGSLSQKEDEATEEASVSEKADARSISEGGAAPSSLFCNSVEHHIYNAAISGGEQGELATPSPSVESAQAGADARHFLAAQIFESSFRKGQSLGLGPTVRRSLTYYDENDGGEEGKSPGPQAADGTFEEAAAPAQAMAPDIKAAVGVPIASEALVSRKMNSKCRCVLL